MTTALNIILVVAAIAMMVATIYEQRTAAGKTHPYLSAEVREGLKAGAQRKVRIFGIITLVMVGLLALNALERDWQSVLAYAIAATCSAVTFLVVRSSTQLPEGQGPD